MAILKDLLKKANVTGTNLVDFDIECTGLSHNSLKCSEGDVFICIPGEHVDGHDFICTAVQNGAKIIVCERVTPWIGEHPEVAYITVQNTRLAAAHMWNELCGRPSERLMVVAVTGTNGKTSTTYFLREIFKYAGYKTGVIGTVKCLIGDKEAVLSDSDTSNVNSMTTPSPERLYPMLRRMADEGVEIVFMEASSHSLSQYRLDPIKFIAGVFTGLTQDHLDFHGSMEEYYLAKRRLFSLCSTALINVEGVYSRRLCNEIITPSQTYGVDTRHADFFACNVTGDASRGISYTFGDRCGSVRIECPTAGEFMVQNTLAAASTARLFGIKKEVIANALSSCGQIPGRMERVMLDGADFDVFIDYAHTPDALERVLKSLLAFKKPSGRLIAVFGCGGGRDKGKRAIMGRIATTLANLTVITSDNSRSENPRAIICDILRGAAEGAEYKVIERREKAIRWVIENHREGDVILLAGKGHEDYEIDENGKRPFSEKDIIFNSFAGFNKQT